MKNIFLSLLLCFSFLLADENAVIPNIEIPENNSTSESNISTEQTDYEPIIVKDTSGLSDDEVRAIVKQKDSLKTQKVSIKDVFEATDEKGKVDISQIQRPWKELSPSPKKFDWVQTKGGEWFKGEIKAMFDDELEFDSDEMDLYTFDFEDVKQIKSFQIISTNIEGLASFSGILRLKDNNLTIINGANTYNFKRSQIVSFAKSGKKERDNWSVKVTASGDIRSGNSNQADLAIQATIKRRTNNTRVQLDYLGRISRVEDIETSNDHRGNIKYDRYLKRNFFWTPFYGEYYKNKLQNIDHQYTLGFGIGYTIIDKKKLEWDISAGPGFFKTYYVEVEEESSLESSSISLQLSTLIDYELSSAIDLKYNYQLTLTQKDAGLYKHHMVLTMENEITKWLDFDINAIWDYTKEPEKDASGVEPLKDDYQLLLGLGVDF